MECFSVSFAGVPGLSGFLRPLRLRSDFTRIPSMGVALAAVLLLAPAASPAAALHGQSLDLGGANTGLSIGNSQVWNGVRINWRDSDVRQVNGISVTLWKPRDTEHEQRGFGNPDYVMNGIALGVVGPEVHTLRGVGIGLGGVLAHGSASGITLGGLGVISGGDLSGISLGGLGVISEGNASGVQMGGLGIVTEGHLTGIQFGGLGIVTEGGLSGVQVGGLGIVSEGHLSGLQGAMLGVISEGNMSGVQLAGLGLVSEGPMTGLQVAGLGVVAQGGLSGVTVAGLGAISEGEMRWVNVAGVGLVGSGDITGVNVGGVGMVAGRSLSGLSATAGAAEGGSSIRGVTAAGYRVRAPQVDGLAASVAMLRTRQLRGLSVAAYNEVEGVQLGVTVGVFNTADVLRGVQIGVLNRAKNNRPPFRWLPLVNANF